MSVEKAFNKFGKRVVKQARTALTKKDKNVNKKLYNSIKYNFKKSKNSIELSFEMADYGKYQDEGVRGAKSSARAPKSPYKFGSGTGKKGGLSSGILEWVRKRRIQFKDRKTGRFLSYKSTSFLISRSVYFKGIKASEFFSRPFESAFKSLPDEVVEAYGLQVDKLLNDVKL